MGRCTFKKLIHRLGGNLRRLENHLIAVAKNWTTPDQIQSMIHGWLRDQGKHRHHGDPFDRLIIAQAQVGGLTVVTRDEDFPTYGAPLLW